MKEDLQENEELERGETTCNGKPKPKDPPNPGDRGGYICGPDGWQWVPAG